MTNWSFILDRIKDELCLPFQVLEKSDEEIIDYCRRNCVKKFSTYFPAKNYITLDSGDVNTQVPNVQSQYYILDPDDREILTVVGFHTALGDYVITGHNPIGAFSFDSIPNLALTNFVSNNLRPFSVYERVCEFLYPNKLRIAPKWTGQAVVEYERVIDPELSDINSELEDYFIELCISMVFMLIGRIRKKYTNIQTPYGEISLDADSLFTEGQTRYDRVMEDLQNKCLPNVLFERG